MGVNHVGYETIQTALATVIKKRTGYSANNVTEDDYNVLAKGNPNRAVVLRRGPSESRKLTMGNPYNRENIWAIFAEVFVASSPRHADLSAQVNKEALVIRDEILKWPQLDNTSGVVTIDVEIFDEPEEGDFGGGRARSKWWRQVVEVLVIEIEAVTLSE